MFSSLFDPPDQDWRKQLDTVSISFGSGDLGGGDSGENDCGSGTLNSGNYQPSRESILRGGRGQLKSKSSVSKRSADCNFFFIFSSVQNIKKT